MGLDREVEDIQQEMAGAPVQIYSFYGISPDDLGYLGAMYSRSSETILKKVESVTQPGRSESFFDKFYHNYGHRSIGDMSMPNFAIEGITEFDALWIYGGDAHRSRWQGQQRSTRYQDFSVTGYAKPSDWGEAFSSYDVGWELYIEAFLNHYQAAKEEALEWYQSHTPKPEDMDEKVFERALQARAFDVARSFLPLAMRTSIFQITSARTLEDQISELLTCGYTSPQLIGWKLAESCKEPMIHVERERLLRLLRSKGLDEAAEIIEKEQPVPAPSPTLTRYTSVNRFRLYARALAQEWAQNLFPSSSEMSSEEAHLLSLLDTSTSVRLVDLSNVDPVIEAAAKFIFPHTRESFAVCVKVLERHGEKECRNFLDRIMEKRGSHDEMPFEFRRYPLNFEIVMDIGSWRDLRRHRRCDQFHQEISPWLGWVHPLPLEDQEEGLSITPSFDSIWPDVLWHYQDIAKGSRTFLAPMILPMATKVRTLFCMDMAQAHYMIELRSKPSGHFTYREVVRKMYEEIIRVDPGFQNWVRICKPTKNDWLKR